MIGTSKSKKVKITNILDSQILDFIQEESPDFKDFLNQYYVSQESEFGSTYLSDNLTSFKDISATSNNILNVNVPNILAADPSRSYDSSINAFDDEIPVTTTDGYPDQYGLFKIDNEIITYTGKTPTSFTGCIRGLSAISSIEKSEYLTFSETDSNEHFTNLQINVDSDGNPIIEEYKVTVESKDETHPYWKVGSNNGYLLNGNQSPSLTLLPGRTYKFNQSDISNSAHPIRFYLEANKTTSYGSKIIGGEEKPANEVIYYADGIKDKVDEYYNSFSTASVRYIQITVDYGTPTVLHYMCTNHGYMGNAAQINQNGGRPVLNLSSIFINEFYRKHKSQFLPGFEGREFVDQVNIENILTRAKDFYRSKGTDTSLEILFKVLFGKSVVIEKPFENTIGSSDSEWVVTDNMIVDVIEGDPFKLISTKIFQGTFDNPTADGTISNIQEVFLGSKKYYKLSFDKSAHFGSFNIGTKTKITEKAPDGSSTINVDSTVGFGTTGTFIYKYLDEFLVASYTSKSENQFFGCTGIVDEGIAENSDIIDDTFIFGYENGDPEKVCTMRITGTISKPSENVSNSKYASVGESIRVNYLGEKATGPKFDTWLYNHSTVLDIEGVFEDTDKTNIITTKEPLTNFLYQGCKVDIIRYDWAGGTNDDSLRYVPTSVSILTEGVGYSTATDVPTKYESTQTGIGTNLTVGITTAEGSGGAINGVTIIDTGIDYKKDELIEIIGGVTPAIIKIDDVAPIGFGKTKPNDPGFGAFTIVDTDVEIDVINPENGRITLKKGGKQDFVDKIRPHQIRKKLAYADSSLDELSPNLLTNIQNTYIDDVGNTYVTFSGYPSYPLESTNRSVKVSNFDDNEVFIADTNHSFLNGEKIFFEQNPLTVTTVTTKTETTDADGTIETETNVSISTSFGLGITDSLGNSIESGEYHTSIVGINSFRLAITLEELRSGNFLKFNSPTTGISTVVEQTDADGITIMANDSTNFSYLTRTSIVPSASGSGSIGGFDMGGSYLHFAGFSGTRSAVLNKLDARNFEKIKVYAKVGNDSNGGESPEKSNEVLQLDYGIEGDPFSNFAVIGTIIPILSKNESSPNYNDGSLKVFELDIPDEAKKENVFFRLIQRSNDGSNYDHYGIQKIEITGQSIAGVTTTTTTSISGITTCIITPNDLANNILSNQNQFKRILKTPEIRESEDKIIGPIGVQLNGVELYSPVLEDFVCYGQIDDVVVTNKGENYDVVNPPNVSVASTNGSGAKLYGHFSGNISEIVVTHPGFNYVDTPQVSVTGGNIDALGKALVGEAYMRGFIHSFSFNDISNLVTNIDLDKDSVIHGEDKPHKFENGEEVVYTTTGNPIKINVGFGTTTLTSGSTYFIRKNSEASFSLTVRKSDALSGINTINFVDFGSGTHTLRSKKIRKIIDRISLPETGVKYQNRKVVVDSNIYPPEDPKDNLSTFTGINKYDNYIFAKNHGFSEGDFIEYKCNSFGDRIVGLNTITQYRINKISNDKFKLVDIGNEEINHAIGCSLSRTLRLTSHTYTDGATSWQMVDDASTDNGFVGVQLRNLIVGSKYKISITVDNNAALDPPGGFNHRVLSQRIESTRTIFSHWEDDGTGTAPTGVLTGEFIALTENEDEFIFYANSITVNVSNFKVELIENTNSKKYDEKIYVDLGSVGVGIHTFRYQDIVVNIKGNVNAGLVTSTLPSYYNATAYPIIDGSLDNVFVQNGGSGYGTTDITNYNTAPTLALEGGQDAELSPVINNGKIVNVSINIEGTGYSSPPILNVVGTGTTFGKFAKLKANVSSVGVNSITSVDIIDGGKDYISGKTSINVVPRGVDAKLKANVHKWNINARQRYSSVLGNDIFKDTTQVNAEVKLQNKIVAFYAGVEYRKSLNDNIDEDKKEITPPSKHSPILGWAYDGNPIYGPYGYADPIAGIGVTQLFSSYQLNKIEDKSLRPDFVDGYFIEDYLYIGDRELDQFNGRYGQTPEFPNGTYAYFTTETKTLSQFPYTTFIHRNKTDAVNYDIDYKQTDKFIDSGLYKRNVSPLGLNEKFRNYLPLSESLETDPELEVTACLPGKINQITTFESGRDYKVGDTINLNDSFVDASVGEILGKEIKKVEEVVTNINNLNFSVKDNVITASGDSIHNFSNNDVVEISGITSSSYFGIQGLQKIEVNTTSTFVSVAIADTTSTGISTSIKLDVSTNSGKFKVNDVIQIDNEKMLIIGLDKLNDKYVVSRMHDSSVGGTHNIDSTVNKLEKSFTYKVSGKEIKDTNVNEEKIAYVNVTNSIGIGSTYTSVVVGTAGSSNITKSIPPRAIYIPNHNFKNGDKVSLVSIGGTIIASKNDSLTPDFNLSTINPLYCVKISNNYIGLSTEKVGFLTSYVYYKSVQDNDFFGKEVQIKTNENKLIGSAKRVNGLVTLGTSHSVSVDETIRLNISPNRTEKIKFKFDSNLRNLIVDPKTFENTGIGTTLSTITIPNHGFETGDAVLYNVSTGSPINGLSDNKIYYAIRISENIIKLSETYKKATRKRFKSINITGIGSDGILSKVNPKIHITKGNTLEIDTSDSSLKIDGAPLRINFYSDINFKDKISSNYIQQNGEIGDGSTDSKIIIRTSDISLERFYYRVENDNLSDNFANTDIQNHSTIDIIESKFNRLQTVTGVGNTTITFNSKVGSAETTTYSSYLSSGFSTATYSTNAVNDQGPITSVKIINFGKNTNVIPSVTSVGTTTGINAVFSVLSNDIAKIEDTDVTVQGWEFSKNKSLKPKADTYAILDLKNTLTLKSIGVSTGGRNYTTPPKVIGVGNTVITTRSRIDGNSVSGVDIISNDSGLQEDLRIIPTFNSNGINIVNATSASKNLTLELKAPIGGQFTDGLPFAVGDKIFVENVQIKTVPGLGTTDLASYNSSDYDYRFFEIIAVSNGSASANPSVTYSISGISTTEAGNFDGNFIFGRVTKAEDLASFEPEFQSVEYVKGEVISIGNGKATAIVSENGWDPQSKTLKVTDIVGKIDNGDEIIGSVNSQKAIISNFNTYEFDLDVDVFAESLGFWKSDKNKPNFSYERLHDNDYYQRFSYALRGQVDYETWKEPVNSLGHISGYKNFADYEIISNTFVGVSTIPKSDIEFRVEILSDASVHEQFDYDFVSEEETLSNIISREVQFDQKKLTDYIEAKTNKVLLLDDISNQFTGLSTITGQLVGLKNFPIKSSGNDIMHQAFDPTSLTIGGNTISIVDHGFTDGEELEYDPNPSDLPITTIKAQGSLAEITTQNKHELNVDNHILITGVSSSLYNGRFLVAGITSERTFTYNLPSTPNNLVIAPSGNTKVIVGSSIGIVTTSAPGIAETSILPSKVFVNVSDANNFSLIIKSSESASGSAVTFSSVSGIGNQHTLSVNSREASIRSLITIDNVIQSPLGKKSTVLGLSTSVGIGSTEIFLNDISKVSGNKLLKINDEIMFTGLVGIGSTNSVSVVRGYMGTVAAAHTVGAGVSELYGDYRISKGNIYFSDAPYGPTGIGTLAGSKIENDEVVNIPNAMTTRSAFTGRVFFRKNDVAEGRPGSMNRVVDDISDNFDGTTKLFDMKENSAVLPVGITTYGGALLINNIFQKPFFGDVGSVRESDYRVQSPVGGGTTIQFLANPDIASDTTDIPRGGRINEFLVGVGSGYQVPTRALAYANIGVGGTIESVSISTHGQGYITAPRVAIGVSYANYTHKFIRSLANSIKISNISFKTPTFAEYDSFTGKLFLVIPNHGLSTSNTIQIVDNSLFFTCSRDGYVKEKSYPRSTDPASGKNLTITNATTNTIIVNVGAGAGVGAAFTSVVSAAGTITAINVVNPGTGYTATKDEPFIIIDEPTPYKNIPLLGGNGSGAKMDVVVGTGGSVIDFNIVDRGTGYEIGDNLVLHGLPVQVGVSTIPFNITVKSRYQDKFSGFTFGELIELDDFSSFFNGFRRSFLLTRTITNKEYFSIVAADGSGIVLANNLLVFVNDILQKPGVDYEFEGGTRFKFTEAPKAGSKFKIYFYKGSGTDVEFVDVDETIKPGDILTLDAFDQDKNNINEFPTQDPRVIYELTSATVVETQTYTGPGISSDPDYLRPVRWKKQTVDKIIDGEKIQKNRNLNTSQQYPATNIIASINPTDTVFSVKDIVSFSGIDNLSETQNSIKIIDQKETQVAIATATVDLATEKVSTLTLINAGFGYTTAPMVAIQPPNDVGTGAGVTATGGATIDGNGVVTGIAITNPGDGYTFNPQLVIEQPNIQYDEKHSNISFNGDRGIIIGINTAENGSNSGVSTNSPALTFDIIPTKQLPGAPSTKSGIVTGQYIVIQGTSFGDGIVSIGTHTSKIVSVGNSFADNVYQVGHYQDVGTGSTVRRIICNINTALSGINTNTGVTTNRFIGNYSWGTITVAGSRNGKSFEFYNQNGLLGIETSAHISRSLQLKQVY